MLAISRALMARPQAHAPRRAVARPRAAARPRDLRDRPRGSTSEERTTILLVEQNANLALGIADYGYIMEGGRIVLDGEPGEAPANEDVKEFYLGHGAGAKSYRNLKFYKRRKRWL